MTVALLSPPSRVMNHFRPPLALMYLSGYLKKNGIEAKIIDVTLKDQVRNKSFYKNIDQYLAGVEDRIIREVDSLDSDIVGITCYTPELYEVERLAARIKSVKPEVKIVAGGIHPTLYPNDFLGPSAPFDFVVIGEGEVTLLELVNAIRFGNGSHADVKGIGYFDKRGSRSVLADKRPLVEALDDVSFPDYEDLGMEFYTTASPYAIRGVFTRSFYVLSSRGCPSSCTFCVSKKLRDYHGIKKFVRLRSPLSLFNEIHELREKYGIDSFYFIDDLFTLRKENVFEFCDLMIKNKSPLIWGCSSKVNTVDYDMLKAMRDAGCVQIDFGAEKGSDEALRSLKKGITIAQVKKTFQLCSDLGIRTFANMLVNTPGEEEKDLRDIIDLVEELKPNIVSFNVFAPYPGCEIYDAFCDRIEREDYSLLMNTALFISEMPEKFRFSSHSIDFLQWTAEATKKYNKIWPNLSVYLKPIYLRNIMCSKYKRDYVKQFISLLREFTNQKF